MSSYMIKARDRKTGTEYSVFCIDDYFGWHKYGYEVKERDGDVLTEDEFRKQYVQIKEE